MGHSVTVVLSDEEYAALAATAAAHNTTLDVVIHNRLVQSPDAGGGLTEREMQEYLFQHGAVANVPTGEPDAPEDEAEAERLAQLLSGGKTAAEMVIEDRGPF